MKKFKRIFTVAALALCGLCLAVSCSSDKSPKVTVSETEQVYILDNGIVTAQVAKSSGDLVSLRYKGKEMLATQLTPDGQPDLQKDPPGANAEGLNRGMTDHQYGFWSHDAMGPAGTEAATATITIDPSKNGGNMAEVSIKGLSHGTRRMGTGPGAPADGQIYTDIDIRFSLSRGESGVYTYCFFEHPASYPYTSFGEARFCAKLADFFDWMSVAENRDMYFPKDLREGDKYIYTVPQYANRAFGWSSTTDSVGLFFINPSMEYMSGGPTKVEFLGHRDTNPVAAPCVLNYWRSSHYGGAEVNIAAGEEWSKVVGPFMIYVNSGTPAEVYADAKAQAVKEAAKWPYGWVNGVSYPKAEERSTVKGRLALNDGDYLKSFTKVTVGLTAPEYASPRAADSPAPARQINWQRDAKNYQFWVDGNADGTFSIPNVRAGKYSLYAFADGVLGEYLKTDVEVAPGTELDLGELQWTPVRHGRQLWEIGIPSRNPREFFKAEDYWKMDIALEYPVLFPEDVTFTVGKSDVSKDWYFMHVPHYLEKLDKTVTNTRFGRETTTTVKTGRATPYTVVFDLPEAPKGTATLRFAICGTGARGLDIKVNGKDAGTLGGLPQDGAISRHGIQAIWYERDFTFDASMMKAGENRLSIIVPEGAPTNGMLYDYIRLEVEE